MGIFAYLRPNEKEAVGLLQIGTFLEYFDLMLYVHMSVLLNELFFPKTDPYTASLLSAFAFCSTYIFRPFGALLFGYLGDNIGRKSTVIITTVMMSISCVVMATVPTYAQIGISAAWIVTVCRMMQGMSSMGEIVGAELYLTEMVKPPHQYPVVALIGFAAAFGSLCALGVASIMTTYGFDWRNAFWIGACIALVGTVARTRLRESPEFIKAQSVVQHIVEVSIKDSKADKATDLTHNNLWSKPIAYKTTIAYFLVQCAWPVCFYFAYVYVGDILKQQFHYTSQQVIHHNLVIALIQLASVVVLVYLSAKIYPLKILRFKLILFSIFIVICPYLVIHVTSPFELMLIQSGIILLALDNLPAIPIFFKHFPVLKRFTYASLTFALSRALMYVVTSFGIVYLINIFGPWGMLIIMIPITVGYAFGLSHFEYLEREALESDT